MGRSAVDSVGESPAAPGDAIATARDGEAGDQPVAGPAAGAKSCRSLRNLRGSCQQLRAKGMARSHELVVTSRFNPSLPRS